MDGLSKITEAGGSRDLHAAALAQLSAEWKPYAELREVSIGHDHPFSVYEGLVWAGLAERRIEDVMQGTQVRGCRYFFRALPA